MSEFNNYLYKIENQSHSAGVKLVLNYAVIVRDIRSQDGAFVGQ